jgi:hypothetical protein
MLAAFKMLAMSTDLYFNPVSGSILTSWDILLEGIVFCIFGKLFCLITDLLQI